MSSDSHIINRQVLEFAFPDTISVKDNDSMLDNINALIVPALERAFDRLSTAGLNLRIESLELDLGVINPAAYEHEVDEKVIQCVENYFKIHYPQLVNPFSQEREIVEDERKDDSSAVISPADSDRIAETITFFLLNGYLPWWATPEEFNDFPALLSKAEVVGNRNFLLDVSHHLHLADFAQRLAWNAPPAFMEKFLEAVLPERKNLVLDLIQFLNSAIKAKPLDEGASMTKQMLYSVVFEIFSRPAIVSGSEPEIVNFLLVKLFPEPKFSKAEVAHWIASSSSFTETEAQSSFAVLDHWKESVIEKFNLDRPASGSEKSEISQFRKKARKEADEPERLKSEMANEESDSEASEDSNQGSKKGKSKGKKQLTDSSANSSLENQLSSGNVEGTEEVAYLTGGEKERQSSGEEMDWESLSVEEKFLKWKTQVDKGEIEMKKKELYPIFPVESDSAEGIIVPFAGLILLWPYFRPVFDACGYLEKSDFISNDSRNRAIHLLHFIACGNEEPAEESQLAFCKFICGLSLEDFVPDSLALTEFEMEEAEGMMEAAIANWPAIGKSSPNGLRGSFLQRSGKLSVKEFDFVLQLEKHSLDILLERLTWGLGVIRLPWRKELLHVEW